MPTPKPEEIEAQPRIYTVQDLRVGMKTTVRIPGGLAIGRIVIIDISAPPHEEIWLAFPDCEKPVGPWRAAQISINEEPTPENDDDENEGTDMG